MSYDEMELDMIGDQKTAMFVIISDTDDTFNFVVAIMYTQLLICSVIKQMMSMVEDFRTMCDYCWMSSVILVRSRNLIN